ncbi:DUF506 family protein [Quillaja saponaria]|uniref:DUF506 family protein n=1 Tax=Quillaja saponaria TaxID=32244 RepID=A0AAD7M2D5_QUISA|nr:DUF506 family protein [Quillaja saponaria]
MGRIPVRFQRVAAAFDADVARVRLCESSGSEHSPESSTDLSDLVKSFMEKNYRDEVEDVGTNNYEKEGENHEEDSAERDEWSGSDKKEKLQTLFGLVSYVNDQADEDENDQNVKEKIRAEVEIAYGIVGDMSSQGFKRRLMTHLRERGLDAGLCKSKWEKTGRFPAGDYEYVDVNFSGKRYIVEVSLALEFEIARPTTQYSSLLDVFPMIFVGKVALLKQVVRLMCNAIKESMKSADLYVPPWRRNSYMQAKWFSSYKRTINEVSTRSKATGLSADAFSAKRSVGFDFEALPAKAYNCRDAYGSKNGFKVGLLTAALGASGIGMQL